jgi:hypothetical protein
MQCAQQPREVTCDSPLHSEDITAQGTVVTSDSPPTNSGQSGIRTYLPTGQCRLSKMEVVLVSLRCNNKTTIDWFK